MLFTSFEFAIFLPLVFSLYWYFFGHNFRAQNTLLLLASYLFYGWWDWRFLILLILISVINYSVGIIINENEDVRKKRIWFYAVLIINIGILAVFKYFNFFIDSFIDLVSLFGYNLRPSAVNIILPLGISFYIFLSLSYIIDIKKGNFAPDRNIINVLLTLSFFPIIFAGPIQRPSALLPQIRQERRFNYKQAVNGLRHILWGLIAKVVVADRLAPYIDDIFSSYSSFNGSTLLAGAVLYTIQIYADFSGYSNMAIGVGKLFGFELMKNFAYPYFARDISEFWKRWHISLTTWFRDYVFLPLSFSISWKVSAERVAGLKLDLFVFLVASIVTWLLTGLWHGANYTFIIWGLINGLSLIVCYMVRKPRKKLFKKLGLNINHSFFIAVETLITFGVIVLAWIFFRSDTIKDAGLYISQMFSASLFTLPQILPKRVVLISLLFIIAEWFQRNNEYPLQFKNNLHWILRWEVYLLLIIIVLSSRGSQQQFIYFQF